MKKLILILILFPTILYGQGWEKTLNPGYGFNVKETSDGGFIIAGSIFTWEMCLIKTDKNGNTLWAKTYGDDYEWSTCVIQTSDGEYVLTGKTGNTVFLMRVNSNGDINWTKAYDFPSYTVGYSVQNTDDGGYMIFATSGSNACLIKTDVDGAIEWTKKYGGSIFTECFDGQQTSDLGYVLFGRIRTSAYEYGVFMLKTNVNGDSLWSKAFYEDDGVGYIGQQTKDGGYIITGETSLYNMGKIFLIKTDNNGDILWTRTYGEDSMNKGYAVRQTSDGGFILTGALNQGLPNCDLFLLKTNNLGDTLWKKRFGGEGQDWGYSVQETSDYGFILAGQTDTPDGGTSIYLIKTDSEGSVSFSEEFPISNPNRKLIKTVDISGKEVLKPEKNQLFIDIYDDGTTKKKMKLK